MDGADWGLIFLQVVVPLSMPAIAAYVSVTVLTAWNMFIWPLVATTDLSLRVLPIALSALVTQRAQGVTPNLAMMAVLISTLPIIAIFIPLQRYFVSGLVGAVKESSERRRCQASVRPPLTANVCPVMKSAPGDARNATRAATSPGLPIRLSATDCR